MKKIFSTLAIATALIATACSQAEDLASVQTGSNVKASFTAQLPEAIGSRAYSDGTTATDLSYAVYADNETAPLFEGEAHFENGSLSTTVDMDLVTGRTYDILFWAQSPNSNAYTVAFNGQTLSVDYTSLQANDENNDAFYYFLEDLKVEGAVNKPVTLYRPLAQINLGTDDFEAAKKAGLTVGKTSMVTTAVYNTLNLANGEVSGETPATFAANAIPAGEDFPVNPYQYLEMSYVLVGGDKSLTDCTFTIIDENGNEVNTFTVANVPVQRNYRTNIYGSLLTDPAKFTVTIDPIYNTPDYAGSATSILDQNKLDEAKANGGEYTLDAPMTSADFTNVASDLYVFIKQPVDELILGETTRATAGASLTIEFAADIAYPTIKTVGTVNNLTLKGDLNTTAPLTHYVVFGHALNNVTISNIKAEGQGGFEAYHGGKEFTVKNCVGTGLTKTFVKANAISGINILNNNLTYTATTEAEAYKHGFEIVWPYGATLIEGNTIANANKHGVMINHAKEENKASVTLNKNIITGATEDGIKADDSNIITVTKNQIQAKQHGVRLTRLAEAGAWEVSENIFDMSINQGQTSSETFYAATIGGDKQTASVALQLTAWGNIANNVKAGRHITVSEKFTLSGNNAAPFNIADGVAITTDGNFGISSAKGLKWIADIINGTATSELVPTPHNLGWFEGRTLSLLNDIDMSGIDWTPIADGNKQGGANYNGFAGTFDGQGHIISNLTVTSEANAALFDKLVGGGLIKNLTISNANVKAGVFAGAVVAYCYGVVENCLVIDSNIESTTASEHAGAIAGYLGEGQNKILNCSVTNTTVKGTYHVGAIAGAANDGATVKGCAVKDSTVIGNQDGINDEAGFGSQVNAVVGWNVLNKAAVSGNTVTNTTVKVLFDGGELINGNANLFNEKGMVWFANQVNKHGNSFDGKTVTLTGNANLAGIAWEPVGQTGNTTFLGIFDGGNKTISNLNVTYTVGAGDDYLFSAGLFGWVEGHSTAPVTIKNVVIDGATINSVHYIGTVAGHVSGSVLIDNCKVSNTVITANFVDLGTEWDYADKNGGVAGYVESGAVVSNCHAETLTLNGYRQLGGVIGYLNGGCTATNCTVGTGITINVDATHNYKGFTTAEAFLVNPVIGVTDAAATVSGISGEATINYPEGF